MMRPAIEHLLNEILKKKKNLLAFTIILPSHKSSSQGHALLDSHVSSNSTLIKADPVIEILGEVVRVKVVVVPRNFLFLTVFPTYSK